MSDIEWTDRTTARFWSYVDRAAGPAGCWLWTGAGIRQQPFYGKMRVSGHTVLAHRASVFLRDGAWPSGVVMHTCDVRACVNPAHLRCGTQAENVRDCHAKGRAVIHRGEASAHAKLTADLVRLIRRRLAAGDSLRAIGRDLGVCHTTIASVKLGRTWRAA